MEERQQKSSGGCSRGCGTLVPTVGCAQIITGTSIANRKAAMARDSRTRNEKGLYGSCLWILYTPLVGRFVAGVSPLVGFGCYHRFYWIFVTSSFKIGIGLYGLLAIVCLCSECSDGYQVLQSISSLFLSLSLSIVSFLSLFSLLVLL